MKPILLALAAALSLSSTLAQAAPTPAARAEIAHLVGYLKASGCSFNRNGSWHDAGKAAQHLERKYEYLVKRDLIATSEDFIDRAASESSMTGKPYQVRCGSAAPVDSAAWLKAELAKYRAAQRASHPVKHNVIPASATPVPVRTLLANLVMLRNVSNLPTLAKISCSRWLFRIDEQLPVCDDLFSINKDNAYPECMT